MEKLTRQEIVAMVGGALLAVSLFINWYASVSDNATLAGVKGVSDATGWDAHHLLRFLLLLAAIAPFVLAYIIATDKTLSWARGEMTAVVAIAAFGFVVYNGVIDRPGDPSGQIELRAGWYVALAGTILMLAGSALRSTETERRRKPPGTI